MARPLHSVQQFLLEGQVIPACPLALGSDRQWSERHQRALVRYYLASGAGGLAVGVHSTQFEIRDPKHGLYQPVLELVADELDAQGVLSGSHSFVRVAGVCGALPQAFQEAQVARELGYDTGLVSMAALDQLTEHEVIGHCRTIAKVIPIFGFYLQLPVGGRRFTYDFWQRFLEIPELVAIKIAPFNRYDTWDVVRAVIESGREDVALYTGNDDHIILDLLTPFRYRVNGEERTRYIVGGLLGQWAVWTSKAVEMLDEIKRERTGEWVSGDWLSCNSALTDANAVIFDAPNQFSGCIPGIMEVLRRQGLVPSNRVLDPAGALSPGQDREIDRISAAYPELSDDAFVRDNLDRWLA